MGRARSAAAAAAVAALLLAGCGAPRSGQPVRVPDDDVPYSLLSPRPTTQPATTSPAASARLLVHFTRGRQLVAVPITRPQAGRNALVAEALRALAAGPGEVERRQGLGTAVPPGTRLSLVGVDGSTAIVSWAAGDAEPPSAQVSLAVGQVVLTVTSFTGLSQVSFIRDGQPVDVPLPSGELASRPVRAVDYAPLLIAPGPTVGPPTTPAPTAT